MTFNDIITASRPNHMNDNIIKTNRQNDIEYIQSSNNTNNTQTLLLVSKLSFNIVMLIGILLTTIVEQPVEKTAFE